MDVSVIIVNYNTKDLTSDCVRSILKFTKDISYEIIIVDNASIDGSQNLIKNTFPEVKLIESDKNLGFGMANNLGTEKALGEFVFFLNSDTILIENSIKKLHDFFIEHDTTLKIGVLGCLLINEDMLVNGFGNIFPNCKSEILKTARQIPALGKVFSSPSRYSYPIHLDLFKIEYVIGADMFLKKALFQEMHGFSIDFFMYYEESDIQKRISNLGYTNYIYTGTKIIHLEDGSGKIIKKYNNRKRIIVHKSRNTYLKKNDAQNFSWYRSLDFIITGMTFLNFKYTFKENTSYFKEVLSTLKAKK
jgi:hypothetical protein